MVLNLFLLSVKAPEDVFVVFDNRVVRGALVTVELFWGSVVGLSGVLVLEMGFFSVEDVAVPSERRVVDDRGGLFSAIFEAAGVILARLAAPPTNGLFVSVMGLAGAFLPSPAELREGRDRWVEVGPVAVVAGRRTEEAGGRVGGLLKLLPGVARLLVDVDPLEAVPGVGAAGRFGAVNGRFGGTVALLGGAGASELDGSAVAAEASSSSTGTSDSAGSSSMAEAIVIMN